MRVGNYEILRKLGQGAYGKVYLARRTAESGFKTWYALKRLPFEDDGDADVQGYVLREARLGGLVNHPALVQIHEVLRLPRELVLVMDYVEGFTLRRALKRERAGGKALPRDVALEIAAAALDALDYVHHLRDPEGNVQGFVHRDVKPGNLMLTAQGALKLTDFGVARPEDAESNTEAGELRGTIAYMAPEQACGEDVGPSADQFAAGLVLIEMLTGHRAWGTGKGLSILHRVVTGDVSAGLKHVSVDDPIRPVLERMLAREPALRYETARDAGRAVRTVRAAMGTPPELADFCRREVPLLDGSSSVPEDTPSWSSGGDPSSDTGPGRGATVSVTWTGAALQVPAKAVVLDPLAVVDHVEAPLSVLESSLTQDDLLAAVADAAAPAQALVAAAIGEGSATAPAEEPAAAAPAEQPSAADVASDDEAEPAPAAPPPEPVWPGDPGVDHPDALDPLAQAVAEADAIDADATVEPGHLDADDLSLDDDDPEGTLPIKSPAVRAAALAAASSSRVSSPAVAPAPPPDVGDDWTDKTLPYGAVMRADGSVSGIPASSPVPPAVPGGPLPPPGLPRRGAQDLQVLSSPVLSTIVGFILLVLVFGLGFLLVRGEADGTDTEALDPPAVAAAIEAAPTPRARPAEPEFEEPVEAVAVTIEDAPLDDGPGPREPDTAELAELDSAAAVGAPRPEAEAPRPVAPRPRSDEPELAPGSLIGDDTPPPAPAPQSDEPLQPGQIIGSPGAEDPRTVDERRSRAEAEAAAEERRRAEEAAAAEARGDAPVAGIPDDTPTAERRLRFLSSQTQPAGAPLSLRVRAAGFSPNQVSVYYQWRGEGSAGRRKRDLRGQADGSYALDLPASELRTDRLQLWFVAEPGPVYLANSSSPLEVRVR